MRAKAGVAVLMMCVASCRPIAKPSDRSVSTEVRVIKENGDPALRFEVTNSTTKPLVVIDRFLPWGGNAANWGDDPALAMTAVDSLGRELPKLYPVRSLGPDTTTTIAPGETAAGTLRMTHYFGNLREALERGDVTVEWIYRLKAVDDAEMVFRGRNTLQK